MKTPSFRDIEVGDIVAERQFPPVARRTLALYAGASGDHNSIHIDLDVAKAAGMPDVFAHGMLSAAYLGRTLTTWVPQEQIRFLSFRFTRITHLGDVPNCSARATGKRQEDGENLVDLELRVTDQRGEEKIVGKAVVALS